MPLPTTDNVANPRSWGYGASLDDGDRKLLIRLADSPDRVSGIQTTLDDEQLPNTAQNPQDIAAGPGQTFSRSRFSGGEGLDRAHRLTDDPDFDVSRYWDSRNMKIEPAKPGIPEELTLLKETAQWRTSTNTNHHAAVIGTTLFWAEDKDVKNTANATATTPTVNSEDPEAGGGTPTAVSGLAGLGDELYAAIGAEGIHKRASNGTWAHWSDLDCSGGKIWSVKDRIIAASGVSLYEAGATDTSTLLLALPSGQTWHDVIDGGSVILAAASNGLIYAWADQDGDLVLVSREDFEGEIPYAMGMAQGVLFVGTGVDTTAGGKIGRLWIGEIIGQQIRNTQKIRKWGSGTSAIDQAPREFYTTRDSMFFSVLEDGSENHLWRFHLRTAGLTRDLIFTESALCQGLEVIDDRLFAFFSGADGWRELTTFASTGYLIGPLVDHFTASPKVQVGVRADIKALVTQQAVTLKYSKNPDAIQDNTHSSWKQVLAFTAATSQDKIDTEQPIPNVASRFLTVQVILTAATDKTTSPSLYSYAQRSLLATQDLAIRVYVNVSDSIKRYSRKPIRVPGQGRRIWTEINDHWLNRSLELELFRPNLTVRGQIVSMSTPIQGQTDRGELQLFSALDIQGVRV